MLGVQLRIEPFLLLMAFAVTSSVEGFSLSSSTFGGISKNTCTANHPRPQDLLVLGSSTTLVDSSDASSETASDLEDMSHPAGTDNAWEVHKFGGASLATADLYRTVGDLLIREAAGREDDAASSGSIPTMAIVSARGGMTDLLVKVVDSALLDYEQAEKAANEAVESQISLLKQLAPPEITDPIEARFRSDGQDILSVVSSLRMLRTVPAVTMEVVTGFGEIWSAQTLNAYLQTKNVPCAWMDARNILVVKSDSSGLGEKGEASTGGVEPLYEETKVKLSNWWNTVGQDIGLKGVDYSIAAPIVIVTGFVATTIDGVPTTLKRSGSDYSATIFAKLTNAGRVTMWKNTDGVYTADPRRVPEAFSIESLKYDEAMELAYFGAQVLHPSAMEPCIDSNIPVYVRNIFNPAFKGTVIQGRSASLKESLGEKAKVINWRSKTGTVPIKGITSVDKTALVTLEGASIGGASVAERFMGTMSDANINVLIITQASSESSITVAVPENEGQRALAALRDTFELELSRSTISSVSMVTGMAIVAIVGEGMALTSGVSSTFMSAMARANVNIRLIAQGSSERQIAVVVKNKDASRALRAVHMAFTLSETTASVVVLGSTGKIGSTLTRQLKDQTQMLKEELGIAASVTLAANSQKMTIGKNSKGVDIDKIPELLSSDEATDFDLDEVTQMLKDDVNPLRVVIDCSNNEDVAEYYERWLASGTNIIGSSTKVAAGGFQRYGKVLEAQKQGQSNWMFESCVGSALPISTTLRDLFETGDKVKQISGCVSSSMAFALSCFSELTPFSEAVREAVEKQITENDFREDFSGDNMAHKVVVLARQLNMIISREDVEVESLIPDEILQKSYPSDKDAALEEMLEDIKCMDIPMLERLKAAKEHGKRLRYGFQIDVESGMCKCGILEVDSLSPLYRLKLNENLVAFETSRYATSPLVVKGAAAGPDLAASAIFAEFLRLTRAYSSQQ